MLYFNEWSAPDAVDDVFADWRTRFFGPHYDRLLAAKRAAYDARRPPRGSCKRRGDIFVKKL